jgi:hypothetical protein
MGQLLPYVSAPGLANPRTLAYFCAQAFLSRLILAQSGSPSFFLPSGSPWLFLDPLALPGCSWLPSLLLGPSGVFWCLLGFFRAFWGLLGPCTACWGLLGLSGAFWGLPGHSGTFWSLPGLAGTFWEPMSGNQAWQSQGARSSYAGKYINAN